MKRLALVVAMAAWTGRAHAQEAGYPEALVARPLALPAGLVALSAQVRGDAYPFADGTIDIWSTDLTVRGGLSALELYGGFGLELTRGDDLGEGESWEYWLLGATAPVTPHGGVRGELQHFNPSSDFSQVTARFGPTVKRQVGPRAAVQAFAGPRYSRTLYDEPPDNLWWLNLFGELRVQVQPAPRLAVEGAVTMDLRLAESEGAFEQRLFSSYELRGLAALSPKLDFYAGLSVGGYIQVRTVVVGVEGRLP